MSPVSHILFHISCLTSPVSRLLYHVFCLLSNSPVSCLLSHVSCLTSPVSSILSHISCLLSPCLAYPVSRILSHVSCLTYPVWCPSVSSLCYMDEFQQNYMIPFSVSFSVLKFSYFLCYINQEILGLLFFFFFFSFFPCRLPRSRTSLLKAKLFTVFKNGVGKNKDFTSNLPSSKHLPNSYWIVCKSLIIFKRRPT